MTKKTGPRNCYSSMEVCFFSLPLLTHIAHDSFIAHAGHTARPTDFCWAPGEAENWTAASASEDNVVMVWQPTMRVWAGEDVRIDEKELESDSMEGIESTAGGTAKAGSSAHGPSTAASASGDD